MTGSRFAFGPYRLDADDASLWSAGRRVPIAPKCFALLQHLVANPGRLVTKDELLGAVWPDTHVDDGVLKVRIREVRAALGDDAGAPRFIATVHRRGYRFIAAVDAIAGPPATSPVGREPELDALRQHLARAAAGQRGLVFVTGEAGIGKTAIVDAFAARLPPEMLCGRGQCLQQHGGGEAYRPLLEALAQMARGPHAAAVVAVLRRLAPSWLTQLPGLIEPGDRGALQRELRGTTRERMLREMAEAVEILATEAPLLLVLEDLHWSDPSTVDLLSLIAHRREPARLLLVVTYRPVDVIVSGHPLKALKQRLDQQRLCAELRLPYLDRAQIAEYLCLRLQVDAAPPGLAEAMLERSAGNPLFAVSLLDHMLERGWVIPSATGYAVTVPRATIRAEVPEGLRQMIEQQIEALPAADDHLLGTASVAGEAFTAAAVAAALEAPEDEVDGCLRAEVRRGRFLRPLGATRLPSGELSERYRFAHALQRDVFYRRLPAARRTDLHRRVGEWQERAGAGAAEIASHFLRAGPAARGQALAYAVRAAEAARAVLGYAEAAWHYETALNALAHTPSGAERQACELHIALGEAEERSGALSRARATFERAAEQARRLGDAELLARAALGMGRGHHDLLRADAALATLLEEALAQLPRREDRGPKTESTDFVARSALYVPHLLDPTHNARRGTRHESADGGPAGPFRPAPTSGALPGGAGSARLDSAPGVEAGGAPRAASVSSPQSSVLRLRACLLARLDAALSPLADMQVRRDALRREAVELARQLDDPDTLLFVLQYTRWGGTPPAPPAELRRSAVELAGLAQQAASKELSLHAQLLRLADLHELGDVEAAGPELDHFAAAAEDAGVPWFRWFARRLGTMRALQDGRLDDAERLAAEALACGGQLDHPNVRPVHAGQTMHLDLLRGRSAALAARLTRYLEQAPGQHLLRAQLALVQLQRGDDAAARRELDRLAEAEFAAIPRDSVWLMTLAYLAEVAAGSGDGARAAVLHRLLAPHAARVIGAGTGIVSLGHGARYVGLLAAALGRTAEAAILLETARVEHERMGARPWLAFTLRDQAQLLLRRASKPSRQQAAEARAQADAIAADIGMPIR